MMSGTTPKCSVANHLPVRPEAVDHLVHDEQDAVVVADLAQQLPVLRRGDMDAVRGRDRLADHRRDRLRPLEHDLLLHPLGAHDVARFALQAEVVAVVVRRGDVVDAGHERAEVALDLRPVAGRQAHRAEGRAVVGAAAGDDLVPLREAAQRLHLLGDLQRRLDRLRAAGAEEDALRSPGVSSAIISASCTAGTEVYEAAET